MNAPCVLPPGVEMQGRAEIPQFWGESHWAQELETILPPLVLPGPETFLSPQLFFTTQLCRHLSGVQVCENGGKKRLEEAASAPCDTILTRE